MSWYNRRIFKPLVLFIVIYPPTLFRLFSARPKCKSKMLVLKVVNYRGLMCKEDKARTYLAITSYHLRMVWAASQCRLFHWNHWEAVEDFDQQPISCSWQIHVALVIHGFQTGKNYANLTRYLSIYLSIYSATYA